MLFAGHSSQLFVRKHSIRAQLRLGKQWWDCIGIAVKGNKTRVQWRHAVIKLALCGEVKVGVPDIKKSLGASFSQRLDDFESRLQAIKNVFAANTGKVSLETLSKMLLSFPFITVSFHGTNGNEPINLFNENYSLQPHWTCNPGKGWQNATWQTAFLRRNRKT